MNRFCFPPAAKPSSFSTSSLSSLDDALSAPVKFDAMRAAVTDLGRTTIFFDTEREQK